MVTEDGRNIIYGPPEEDIIVVQTKQRNFSTGFMISG
jgi:hypothetical protein